MAKLTARWHALATNRRLPRWCEEQQEMRARIVGLFAGAYLYLISVDAQAVKFVPLGHLPGRGFRSEALGISGDGRVVVGSSGNEAFRWTAEEGIVGLGDLPGGSFDSRAIAASFDGAVIVGYGEDRRGGQAFRWTASDGMIALPRLPSRNRRTFATDVSADGTVVVGTSDTPLLWDEHGNVVELPLPPGDFWDLAQATAVSADGSVVVGDAIVVPNGTPFRWTQARGSEFLFPIFDIPRMQVHDVSADGSVVVGRAGEDPFIAFRWTELEGGAFLDPPHGSEASFAWAVSGDGSVIAGFTSTFYDGSLSEYFDAAIWDETHGWRAIQQILAVSGLDMTGWDLKWARDISDDGRVVVGHGINPQGHFEAWMAVIPEPSTLGICSPLALLAACLVVKRVALVFGP